MKSLSTRSALFYLMILAIFGMTIAILSLVVQNNNANSAANTPCCFEPNCANTRVDGDCYADIVIIGCGSAGSVMASMLSKPVSDGGRGFSVVCLERGRYYQNDPSVKYILNDNVFWMFAPVYQAITGINTLSEPDPMLFNFPSNVQQGVQVGGSGNVDYSVILYPSPNLTKQWVAAGGEQWSYDNVTAMIQSYEQYLGAPSACIHGTDGPIANLPVPSGTGPGVVTYDLMQAIIDASPGDTGITPIVTDQNCGYETLFTNVGQYFWRPINASQIKRSSPGTEFLATNTVSPDGYGVNGHKLRIVTESTVDNFHVDTSTMRADYVSANVAGSDRRFYARKQIIVAGNGINTPGVLERSGIGGAPLLSSLGIPLVKDVPEVGENFQYHIGSSLVFITNQTVDTYNFVASQGLLTVLPGDDNSRHMQILVIPGFGFNIFNGQASRPFPIPDGFNPVSMILSVLSPRSRGNVHINSRDPSRWPTINTNAYSDVDNFDFLLVNQTLTTVYQAVQALRTTYPQYEYRFTTPDESVFQSASALENYIYSFPLNQAHWSSTCSMGTVLDGHLAVKGVSGVTVADTSSLPLINNGNTRTQALITGTYAANHLLETL